MINIINNSKNPYFNMAMEEYFVKHKDLNEDVLILWQNEPTIVVGKNQNTYEELNLEYTNEKGIKVVRRLSGGGAVYHDLGNVNFTIIKNDGNLQKNDFSFFALPVIKCLERLGIVANFNGRNDILIDGKKFSGNAQYLYKNKVMHHGTLLFSSDLDVLSQALRVKKEKFESKGIKSLRNRVTNIAEHLDSKVSLSDFMKTLVESMFGDDPKNIRNYTMTETDISEISNLQNRQYSTWEWNFGKSPKMNYRKELRFNSGSVIATMNISEGIINDFKLNGDFFEAQPVELLECKFIGKKYEISELRILLESTNISEYICGVANSEFEQLLF